MDACPRRRAEGRPRAAAPGLLPLHFVRALAFLTVGLLSVVGCKKGEVAPGGGAPTCPEGEVLRGDHWGPAQCDDCAVIEVRGGCAPGFACVAGQGCQPDGSVDPCAADGTCPGDDVCQQGFCVDPNADNDHDGVRAGDDCNDFEADVGLSDGDFELTLPEGTKTKKPLGGLPF